MEKASSRSFALTENRTRSSYMRCIYTSLTERGGSVAKHGTRIWEVTGSNPISGQSDKKSFSGFSLVSNHFHVNYKISVHCTSHLYTNSRHMAYWYNIKRRDMIIRQGSHYIERNTNIWQDSSTCLINWNCAISNNEWFVKQGLACLHSMQHGLWNKL